MLEVRRAMRMERIKTRLVPVPTTNIDNDIFDAINQVNCPEKLRILFVEI
jgi:hypothetical protein